MIEFDNLPGECRISANKTMRINLNVYRNSHYKKLSKAKRWFTSYGMTLPIDGTFKVPVQLDYKLLVGKNSDLMNYGAILDKFMCDVLTKRGLIEDDNTNFIKKVSFEFAGFSTIPTGKLIVSPYNQGF